MKRFATMMVAGLVGMTVAGTSHAATLYTAPTTIDGSDSLRCSIVNTANTPKTVTVQVISTSGLAVSTVGPTLIGSGAQLEASSSVLLFTPSYCKFTVQGGKRAYRAQGCVTHPGSSCDATSVAQ